jgi:outer membrane protein assembly factor BamD
MNPIVKKFRAAFVSGIIVAGIFLSLAAASGFAAGDQNQKKKAKKPQPAAAADTKASAEPDKVLYDRSMVEYKKGKYTEARLDLQTLINTYPDSEFLAKAKLAMGDSFYKEGGNSNLTQAVAQYKDFITFFPFLDEAAYAQMQVAMSHYRMMEKSDRDDSDAESAEDEFQAFLLKYPNSPLVPKAEQHLREVQEVIADGDYRVAHFYYLKGPRSYRAAAARLNEIIERYPLYSQSDKALFLAGSIYDKWEKREIADQYYARIVREYPASPFVGDAKKKLTSAGVPIPQPDPEALARAAEQKKYLAERPGMIQRTMGVIKSSPDTTMAAHSGAPNLTPPVEATSATDVLKPGAVPAVLSSGGGGGTGNSIAVETVQAGSGGSSAGETTAAPANGNPSGMSDVAPGTSNVDSLPKAMEPSSTAPDNATPPADPPAPAEQPAPAAGAESAAPAATGVVATGAPATGTAAGTSTAAAPAGGATSSTESSSTATSAAVAGKGTSNEQTASAPDKSDPKAESSSKKKKGLKKLIPW